MEELNDYLNQDQKWDEFLNYDWSSADTSWFEELFKPKVYDNDLLASIYANNIIWDFEDAGRTHCKNGMCQEYNDPVKGKDFGPGINSAIWSKYGLKSGQQYSEEFLTNIAKQEAKKILDEIDEYIPGLSPKKKLIMLDIKYQTGNSLRESWPILTDLFVNEDEKRYQYANYDDAVKHHFATHDKYKRPLKRRNKGKEQIWDWDENDLENIKLNLD